MTYKFTHDKIAEIAYSAWVDRGQPLGSPEIDWYYALSVVSDPETIRVDSADGITSESEFSDSKSLTDESPQELNAAASTSADGRPDAADTVVPKIIKKPGGKKNKQH